MSKHQCKNTNNRNSNMASPEPNYTVSAKPEQYSTDGVQ